jgi:hypothetical protein
MRRGFPHLDTLVLCRAFHCVELQGADLAIEAYESADARVRAEFDNIANTMTAILTAVGAAMREVHQDKTRTELAEQAIGWVKPLVSLAGAIINGGREADIDEIMAGK